MESAGQGRGGFDPFFICTARPSLLSLLVPRGGLGNIVETLIICFSIGSDLDPFVQINDTSFLYINTFNL